VDKKQIISYADELFAAERSRRPIPPITGRDPSFTTDDAYAVQLENVRRALSMGHTVSGKKIGLTSLAMQKQLGVDEPDYGHLFAAMDCADGLVDAGALILPKIEAELAFVLKKDLRGGKVTPEDVEDATEYVAGAFEIVDSRVADWKIRLPDTVADNASSGRYMLGSIKLSPKSADLAAVGMKLYKIEGANAVLMNEGVGAAVLGDPRISVAWLANKLWGYGVALMAGEVVLSGALSAAPSALKGDVFRAEFTDFGSLEARFV